MKIGIGVRKCIAYDDGLTDEHQVTLVHYKSAPQMVSDLNNDKIDGCVRGNLDARMTLSALKKATGVHPYRMLVVRLKNRWRILYPVGIFDQPDKGICQDMIDSASKMLGLSKEPVVGVLAEGRLEDKGHDASMDAQIDQIEQLAYDLDAIFYGICLEHAIWDCDILIFPNGVVGNYVFRALHLVCRMSSYGAPVWNIDTVYVDSSRSRWDYTLPIKLAITLAEGGTLNDI